MASLLNEIFVPSTASSPNLAVVTAPLEILKTPSLAKVASPLIVCAVAVLLPSPIRILASVKILLSLVSLSSFPCSADSASVVPPVVKSLTMVVVAPVFHSGAVAPCIHL